MKNKLITTKTVKESKSGKTAKQEKPTHVTL